MLEIDVYHEIHTTGFLFGAASSARDTRISICTQALFWQSPSWFINNLGASGYAVFTAPIPFLINRFRSSNHRGSILNNHCSLIVYDLYLSLPPRFFSCGRTSVSLWTDFSFQHLSFRTAQVLFQCRSHLQTICSSCLFGRLLFAVLDPSLKPPNTVLPFHLCTRPLHHTTCFWGTGVHLASCLYLLHVWPWGSISSLLQDLSTVSSVLRVPKERWTTASCYVWVEGWYWLQWDCLHP